MLGIRRMKKENILAKDNDTSDDPIVRITFEVPASLRNAFKAKVAIQGGKLKDALVNFMKEYVKENNHTDNKHK